MAKYDYDILIIGGGPGGYVAGSYATQFGKRVAVIEKGLIGGCCLNVGCIPTKTILEAAMRYTHATGSSDYGINSQVTFDWKKLQAYSEKIRADLRKGVNSLLQSRKCDLIHGEAAFVHEHDVKVGDKIITSENIIVATGALPIIPGKFSKIQNVIISDSFWDIEIQPKTMVIVGGGVIGCEIASALCRLGTKVTIIEQMPEILPQFDTDAVKLLRSELESRNVEIFCGAAVSDVKQEADGLIVSFADRKVQCEYVMWATGRKPVTPDMGPVNLNFTNRGFIEVDSNYRTNIENIYCIGDANGRSMLAHAAISQAMLVINHICTDNPVIADPCVPQTVFTYPSIARLGLTEEESKDRNIAVGKAPYAVVGYSHVIESKTGYFKVLRDIETDTLIGAEIVGYNACELIQILSPYINNKIKVGMFADLMFAHPTLSEGIKLAIEASYTRSPQV